MSSSRRQRKVNHSESDSNEEEDALSTPQELMDACNEIRSFWLKIGSDKKSTNQNPKQQQQLRKELSLVEQRYRNILRVAKDCLEVSIQKKNQQQQSSTTSFYNNELQIQKQEVEDCTITYHCVIHECRTKLALLYIQRGNETDARTLLERMGCKVRLSDEILRYRHEDKNENDDKNGGTGSALAAPNTNATSEKTAVAASEEGCCYVDDVVPESSFKTLQKIFCPEKASYWTEHNYSVDPPSPYFSYVVELDQLNRHSNSNKSTKKLEPSTQQQQPLLLQNTILSELIDSVKSATALKYPKVLTEAKYCEIWSHNRPHFSGHQLHFDSDNEGRDGIRHPLATCVFVVSEDASCGGPTLVTTQKLGDVKMAEKGWLCFPKPNRVIFFESSFLHGVIPGHLDAMLLMKQNKSEELEQQNNKNENQNNSRRVTLMLAFWKEIEVRRGEKAGAARPLPMLEEFDKEDQAKNNNEKEWLRMLLSAKKEEEDKSMVSETSKRRSMIELKTPPPLSHVWVDVKTNQPWPRTAPIVSYEEAFQY